VADRRQPAEIVRIGGHDVHDVVRREIVGHCSNDGVDPTWLGGSAGAERTDPHAAGRVPEQRIDIDDSQITKQSVDVMIASWMTGEYAFSEYRGRHDDVLGPRPQRPEPGARPLVAPTERVDCARVQYSDHADFDRGAGRASSRSFGPSTGSAERTQRSAAATAEADGGPCSASSSSSQASSEDIRCCRSSSWMMAARVNADTLSPASRARRSKSSGRLMLRRGIHTRYTPLRRERWGAMQRRWRRRVRRVGRRQAVAGGGSPASRSARGTHG
jgi:hypothetical protein